MKYKAMHDIDLIDFKIKKGQIIELDGVTALSLGASVEPIQEKKTHK